MLYLESPAESNGNEAALDAETDSKPEPDPDLDLNQLSIFDVANPNWEGAFYG